MTLTGNRIGRFGVKKGFYFLMNMLNVKLLLRETRADGHETDSVREAEIRISAMFVSKQA